MQRIWNPQVHVVLLRFKKLLLEADLFEDLPNAARIFCIEKVKLKQPTQCSVQTLFGQAHG